MTEPNADNWIEVFDFFNAVIVAGSYDPVTHVFTPGGGSGAVSSVFARTGAVVAQSGDYNATEVPNVVVNVTESATPVIDTDNGTIFEVFNLAQAVTSFTTNLTGTPVDGQQICIAVSDNGTARAITWGTKFVNQGATAPTTTVVGDTTYTWWVYNSVASAWVFDHANVNGIPAAAGSPSGVVTPSAVGQTYIDTSRPTLWMANGLTNTDWAVVVDIQPGVTTLGAVGSASFIVQNGLCTIDTNYLKADLLVGNGNPNTGGASCNNIGALYFDNTTGDVWRCIVSGYPATWIPLSWGNDAPSTVAGTAGSLTCSQPFDGTHYKKSLVIVGSTFTSSAGATYTFPVPFAATPVITSPAVAGVTVTVTTTGVTVVCASVLGAPAGITIEGA
jgi:hypothetical protein